MDSSSVVTAVVADLVGIFQELVVFVPSLTARVTKEGLQSRAKFKELH